MKASSTVTAADFRGLSKPHDAVGKRFVRGFVLYDGDDTLPFGDRLFAVPISALWN